MKVLILIVIIAVIVGQIVLPGDVHVNEQTALVAQTAILTTTSVPIIDNNMLKCLVNK